MNGIPNAASEDTAILDADESVPTVEIGNMTLF